MKTWVKVLAGFCVVLFLLFWLSWSLTSSKNKKRLKRKAYVEGIDTFYMHSRGDYSYLKNGKIRRVFSKTKTFTFKDFTVIKDVSPNKKCWFEVYYTVASRFNMLGTEYISYLTSHIDMHMHPEDDFMSAGWKKRVCKTTVYGQTQVLK